jgi:hypothetical protein
MIQWSRHCGEHPPRAYVPLRSMRTARMTDSIRAYLDSKQRCVQTFSTLQRLASIIIEAGAALQNCPDEFGFTDINVSMPAFPSQLVSATEWPTAEEVQRALAACHQDLDHLQGAWSALSPLDRENLMPPGDPWETIAIGRRQ